MEQLYQELVSLCVVVGVVLMMLKALSYILLAVTDALFIPRSWLRNITGFPHYLVRRIGGKVLQLARNLDRHRPLPLRFLGWLIAIVGRFVLLISWILSFVIVR